MPHPQFLSTICYDMYNIGGAARCNDPVSDDIMSLFLYSNGVN